MFDRLPEGTGSQSVSSPAASDQPAVVVSVSAGSVVPEPTPTATVVALSPFALNLTHLQSTSGQAVTLVFPAISPPPAQRSASLLLSPPAIVLSPYHQWVPADARRFIFFGPSVLRARRFASRC